MPTDLEWWQYVLLYGAGPVLAASITAVALLAQNVLNHKQEKVRRAEDAEQRQLDRDLQRQLMTDQHQRDSFEAKEQRDAERSTSVREGLRMLRVDTHIRLLGLLDEHLERHRCFALDNNASPADECPPVQDRPRTLTESEYDDLKKYLLQVQIVAGPLTQDPARKAVEMLFMIERNHQRGVPIRAVRDNTWQALRDREQYGRFVRLELDADRVG